MQIVKWYLHSYIGVTWVRLLLVELAFDEGRLDSHDSQHRYDQDLDDDASG